MEVLSNYLPEETAARDLTTMSAADRQKLVRAYAKHYNLSEALVDHLFNELAKKTTDKTNPRGIIPTEYNLYQPDTAAEAARFSRGGKGIGLAMYDAGIGNVLMGNNNVIQNATDIAMPHWALAGKGEQWLIDKAVKATGKSDWLEGPTWNIGVSPLLTLGTGQYVVNPLVSKIPGGRLLTPWGGLVDVAGTLANTERDFRDNYSGAKARRYTMAARDAQGHYASPWEAAGAYQGARAVDTLVDLLKLGIQVKSGGNTAGMLSAFGGTRLHTEWLPIPGVFDPLLIGRQNKDIAWDALTDSGLKGNIARRKINYRFRNGFGSGLGKTLSGEYFNHEHDQVDRQIQKERLDFRNMADAYTMMYNPSLARQIISDDSSQSGASKYLLDHRKNWLKSTKKNGRSLYSTVADTVGADTSTLD